MKFPCNGCSDRHIGCHSECKKYLNAKKNHEEQKALIIKAKKSEFEIKDASFDLLGKRKRKKYGQI